MDPLISVIVPCYNQAQYLPEALQSLLDQDYPNWECIIVNDGSPDNTEEIALQWVEKDKRIKYFYKENSGVSATRNYGVSKANGKYILPLDGDDKISNEYITKAIKILESSTETKLVYSDVMFFGAKDQELRRPEYNFEKMLFDNLICVSGIFRKEDFLKSGGYNTNMAEGLEDWDFWLSFIKREDMVVKLEGFHIYYRIKEISRSQSIDFAKNEQLLLQIFKNHIPLYLEYINPIRNKIDADARKQELSWHYSTKEYKLGRILYTPHNLLKKLYWKLRNNNK